MPDMIGSKKQIFTLMLLGVSESAIAIGIEKRKDDFDGDSDADVNSNMGGGLVAGAADLQIRNNR